MGQFSPDRGELFGIENGLRGWDRVQGLGPDYFHSPAVEQQLIDYMFDKLGDTTELELALAGRRAEVINFFDLLAGTGEYKPQTTTSCLAETRRFLRQLRAQVKIWREGIFKTLNFSMAERRVLARISAKGSFVLFLMGFPDAIPHSSQVSRLCASMAHRLGGRPSEVFMAAIVGKLHDPKFDARLDIARQNLATHPINAAALAHVIFKDEILLRELAGLDYFRGNPGQVADFVAGIVDALGVNNDSAFVQLMFILPQWVKRLGEKYGPEVAAGFKAVMEGRLESAAKEIDPPKLPEHLHGVLAQEFVDSGLRGISGHGWVQALTGAGVVTEDPAALFRQLMTGTLGSVTQDQIAAIRQALKTNPTAVLTAMISSTRLLHHHQEVCLSGRVAASALVIADPWMLSIHKIAAVYGNAIIERVRSYITSFDDNIRLSPKEVSAAALEWQRAVYIGVLLAADKLSGGSRLADFATTHGSTTVKQDVADLRKLCLDEQSWGKYAQVSGKAAENADVQHVVDVMEESYNIIIDDYRAAVNDPAAEVNKFMPKPR